MTLAEVELLLDLDDARLLAKSWEGQVAHNWIDDGEPVSIFKKLSFTQAYCISWRDWTVGFSFNLAAMAIWTK
jgi:hypothetical protein